MELSCIYILLSDLPIVTKLQDDEQIPSEHSGNKKLVTLLSSQYPGVVEICTTPSQHNKTSPHRMVCSYIQTMLSNKITQTCSSQPEPTVASSPRQKTDTSPKTLSDTSSTPVADTTHSQSWMEESPVTHTTERSANAAGSFSLQETQADKGDRSVSAHEISTDDDDSKKSVPDTTTDTLVVKTQSISITGIKTIESVTVSLEAEQDFSKPSESSPSVSSSQQANEVVPHLKPSSTPSFVEDSHKLTHTPVLETQQPSTSDTQAEDLGKTSVSSKVSPSPAVVVSSSIDTLPTKVIATMLDEEVDEHKDSPGQESDVTESVVKAENITANKDKPLDLMQVPLAPVAKRETAIMRLTNRIKALELNVSLSSRYYFHHSLLYPYKKYSMDLRHPFPL